MSFVRTASAAAICAAAAFATTAASAADKVTWNVSSYGPSRAYTRGIETVAKYVEEKSGGNFTIKIHLGEAISPVKENLDGLRIGAFEAAQLCNSYSPGKTPLMGVLDLPFLPAPNPDVTQNVHEAVFAHPAIKAELKRWNTMAYMSGLLPQYEFMGTGKPPKAIEDWKGMRVRALAGIGEAMKRLGAVPTTVPAPETYTGLERGMFEAASFPFSYSHASYKLHEVSKWYTMGMAPGAVSCPTFFNIDAYNGLPDEYRKMLDDAEAPAYAALKAAYKEADDKNIPMFDKMGLERVVYTPEMRAQIEETAAKPVWDAWMAEMKSKNLPGKEVLDLVIAEGKKG